MLARCTQTRSFARSLIRTSQHLNQPVYHPLQVHSTGTRRPPLSAIGQDINNVNVNSGHSLSASFMGHPVSNSNHFNMPLGAGANVNLKLRQAQWSAMPSPLQHTMSLGNAVDSGEMNGSMPGSMSPSPGISHTMPGQGPPMRTPSANGSRNGMRGVLNHMMGGQSGQLGSMSISPYLQHSPSPNSQSQLQNTPPRPSPTPPMTMVSPSLQYQQMVGGSQGSY